MSETDQTLLGRWTRNRDAEAFKALSLKYAVMVYATCVRILGDATEAQDVTQECFERLATGKGSPKDNLGPWMHRVATNRALNRIKADKRRKAREQRFSSEHRTSTRPEWDDIYEHIDEAIASLPENLRVPIVAHFLENETHEAIATREGVSRPAVTQRVHRGLDQIRKVLERRGIPVSGAALASVMRANLAEASPAVPASLWAILGKLAISGDAASTTVGGSVFAGWTALKTVLVAIVVVVAGVAVVWTVSNGVPEIASGPATAAEQTSLPSNLATASDEGPGTTPDESMAVSTIDQSTGRAVDSPSNGASSTETGIITGRVYDADTDKGIEGVVISAQHKSRARHESEPTGESGRYRLEGLDTGQYALDIQGIFGRYPMPRRGDEETVLLNANGATEVDFVMAKGLSVSGVVVDSQGNAVAEAGVDAGAGSDLQPGRTDAAGRFTIMGFESGDEIHVSAVKNFSRENELRSYSQGPLVVGEQGLHNLRIVVHELAGLSGTVRDSSGHVADDAYVQAEPVRYLVEPPSAKELRGGSASSGADGTFKIGRLFAGTYQVGFRETGVQEEVKLTPGERRQGISLVFDAKPKVARNGQFTITGRVTDVEGTPLLAIIDARSEGDGPRSRGMGHTDKDGAFTISGLLKMPHTVSVRDPDHAPYSRAGVTPGYVSIQLKKRDWGVIQGRVLRADTEQPVAEFRVGHYPVDKAKRIKFGQSFALELSRLVEHVNVNDPEGSFHLGKLEPGETYVVIQAPGYGPQVEQVAVISGTRNAAEVTVRLEREACVEGHVVDRMNNPVGGAFIYYDQLHASKEHAELIKKLAVARSKADGAFVVDELPVGPLTLSAYHPAYQIATADVSLRAGETTPVRITLSGGGTIKGIVRHAGVPVQGQKILVKRRGGITESAKTSTEGTYEVSGLAPGEVEVNAFLAPKDKLLGSAEQRWLPKRAVVAVGSPCVVNFDFVAANAALEGYISVQDNVPRIASLGLKIVTDTGDKEIFRLEMEPSTGAYFHDELPPGDATLWVTGIAEDEKRSHTYTFRLEEAQKCVLDVDFTGGAVVQGRVSGLKEHEQCGVFLYSNDKVSAEKLDKMLRTMNSITGEAAACTAVGEDGSFHIEGIDPIEYTAVAFAVDGGLQDRQERAASARYVRSTVVAAEGQGTSLNLVFR